MAALLTSVLENTDKVIEYIAECEKMDIRVLAPDVNVSMEGFTVSGNDIRFGLLAVKNVGRGLIRELIARRETDGLFHEFSEFCRRTHGREMNKRALESLIKAGALDCVCKNRRAMLESYEAIMDGIDADERRNIAGQISLFGSALDNSSQDYPLADVPEFPADKLLAMEKETTGLFISGHPMAQYADLILEMECTLISHILQSQNGESNLKDGSILKIAAFVNTKRLKSTKNGQMMAFVKLEDTSGAIEMLVFPRVLETCSAVLKEGSVILAQVRLSLREEEEPVLMADSLQSIDEIARGSKRRSSKNPGLYLRVASEADAVMEKVKNLLSIFEGPEKVYFYFEDQKKYFSAPMQYWTSKDKILLRELSKLLGGKNVVLK